VPWDQSDTVSPSGHRVRSRRVRRSAMSASEISTRKSRISTMATKLPSTALTSTYSYIDTYIGRLLFAATRIVPIRTGSRTYVRSFIPYAGLIEQRHPTPGQDESRLRRHGESRPI